MRSDRLFLAAAASGLIAFAAAAQDSAPPAPAADPGLSDVADTIRQLEDAPPAAEQPPESPPQATPAPAPAPPAETAAPSPAPPVAPRPAPPAGPAPPLTRAQTAEIDGNVLRGRQLIAIAQAGSVATRDMLTRISDPEGAGIVGWIAEPAGNAITVTFYANGENGPVAVYRGDVLGGRITERQIHLAADRPALGPAQARMAAARGATEGLDHTACSSAPFNVLVVPPTSATAPIDVYQVTPATRANHFPFGGHFKTSVAPDGTVSASRGFSPNCLDVAAPPTPDGQPTRPLAITDVLDPMPTEIHVFLAALAHRPLLVATGDPQRIWLVTGDRISEVRQ